MKDKFNVKFNGATDAVKEAMARIYAVLYHINLGAHGGAVKNYLDREESFLSEKRGREGGAVCTVYISTYHGHVALYIKLLCMDFDSVIITPGWVEFHDSVRGEDKVAFVIFPEGDDIDHEFPLEWPKQWITKLKSGDYRVVKDVKE